MGSRLVLPILALLVALAVPLAAYTDNDETPLSCSVTLGVTDPGTMSQKKGKVYTQGEQTAGTVDCNVDLMDGAISTIHDSEITVDALGNFSGEMKGTFSLATANGVLDGKLEASINGVFIGWVVPGVIPLHMVTDVGEWKIRGGGPGIKGDGLLNITLVGIVGAPAAWGGLATVEPGSLQGEVKVKDKD